MNDDTSQRVAPHRPDQAGPFGLGRSGWRRVTIGTLLGLVIGGSGQASRAQPATATKPATTATAPATQPASSQATTLPTTKATTVAATAPVPPPPAPKAVALAFAVAIDRGDAAAAKALAVADPAHGKWVESTVKLAGSLKKLDAAATARWAEAGRKVSQNAMGLTEALGALQQAQEKIEGPRATLTQPGAAAPALVLRQGAGGNWRVEAPVAGDQLDAQHRLYAMLTQAAERTATEVARGDYANADQAAAAFARRVLRARIAAA